MKIYTKKGDKGKTQLLGGSMVDKFNPKIEAYGNVDELNNITKLLEYYIQKNPLKFKAWNYLSAIMRYNKDFDRAHIISRVEIGIALTNKNKTQYLEALKSYAKSRIKINKELNNSQKQFIKSI